MKKKIVIVVLLLLTVLAAVTFVFETRGPTLDETYTAEIIDNARQKYNIPALSISVIDAEQIQYIVFDGVRIHASGQSMTSDDYFHIGSCSKSVLSYMAAKLVEEGSISWDMKFLDIYPELKADALEAYSQITLEDLLASRAGIQPYTSALEEYPDLSASQDKELDFIRYLLSQSPSAGQNASGKFEFLYSNASYTLATAMLEKVSGLYYEELLQKYMDQELSIDVFIGWPYEKNRDQPWGHIPNKADTPTIIGPDSVYALNPLIAPAGNLSLTQEGFTKFIQLHLKGMMGIDMQLSSETIRMMDTKYSDFSLGVWNEKRAGKQYICLDGTAGTFYARGVIIPDSNVGFTIMMNCGSEEAVEYVTMKLMKAYYNMWWMFWI